MRECEFLSCEPIPHGFRRCERTTRVDEYVVEIVVESTGDLIHICERCLDYRVDQLRRRFGDLALSRPEAQLLVDALTRLLATPPFGGEAARVADGGGLAAGLREAAGDIRAVRDDAGGEG
ncbi:hypothetical protein [uncultured Methylobacterium sp.]|uniref:hypothetical protein n=1 Tax=uncultured Methylobacterium sp. TaxID=157278 RepID=UPI0035CAFE84